MDKKTTRFGTSDAIIINDLGLKNKASFVDNSVIVEWSTNTKTTANELFVLEQSADGIDFKAVYQQQGGAEKYRYIDDYYSPAHPHQQI